MRKFYYFKSNKEDSRKRPSVEVTRRYWGEVSVSITTPGMGGFMMGAELTPEEAREMAAGLLELADVAEKYNNEQS